jgi:hypothetical protein
VADNKKTGTPENTLVFKQGLPPVGKIEQLDLRVHRLDDAQFARLEKAILVAGVLSGMLAAGRIPTSKDNLATLEASIAKGLEVLNVR